MKNTIITKLLLEKEFNQDDYLISKFNPEQVLVKDVISLIPDKNCLISLHPKDDKDRMIFFNELCTHCKCKNFEQEIKKYENKSIYSLHIIDRINQRDNYVRDYGYFMIEIYK